MNNLIRLYDEAIVNKESDPFKYVINNINKNLGYKPARYNSSYFNYADDKDQRQALISFCLSQYHNQCSYSLYVLGNCYLMEFYHAFDYQGGDIIIDSSYIKDLKCKIKRSYEESLRRDIKNYQSLVALARFFINHPDDNYSSALLWREDYIKTFENNELYLRSFNSLKDIILKDKLNSSIFIVFADDAARNLINLFELNLFTEDIIDFLKDNHLLHFLRDAYNIDEIIYNLSKGYRELKSENHKLIEENQNLKTHIEASPEGRLYLEAREEWEKITK